MSRRTLQRNLCTAEMISFLMNDFLLHDVAGRAGGDLYVEVKGNMSDADAEKINRFISIGAAEAKDYGKIQTAILVVGKIPEGNSIDDIISFICTEAYQNRKEPYYYNFSSIDLDYFSYNCHQYIHYNRITCLSKCLH